MLDILQSHCFKHFPNLKLISSLLLIALYIPNVKSSFEYIKASLQVFVWNTWKML